MTLEEFVTAKIAEYRKNPDDLKEIIREITENARSRQKNGCACMSDEEVAHIVMDFIHKDKPAPKAEEKPVVKEEIREEAKPEIKPNEPLTEDNLQQAIEEAKEKKHHASKIIKTYGYTNENNELVIGDGVAQVGLW